MEEKKFVHYLDKDKNGKDIEVHGWFDVLKEDKNFLVIKSSKNVIRIPYHRIIKLKGGKL